MTTFTLHCQNQSINTKLAYQKLLLYSKPSPYCCACQPGTHGKPGSPGIPGRDGRDGRDGNQGTPGSNGPMGPPGLQGPKGEHGVQGTSGQKGERGETGTSGTSGTPETPGTMSYKNWKECAWQNLNDDKDYGLIKVNGLYTSKCSFSFLQQILFFRGPRNISLLYRSLNLSPIVISLIVYNELPDKDMCENHISYSKF